jgi:hypothetical protein
MRFRLTVSWAFYLVHVSALPLSASALAAPGLVHGLWVWESSTVLETSDGREALLEFCKSEGINEVYLSVSVHNAGPKEGQLAGIIELLHRSGVRVEALLSSTDADEPGNHREVFLGHVQQVVEFNERHPPSRFDGIHLDIEPQQRPENKGTAELSFLSGLTETFREVRAEAEPAGMTVTADIQNKLLKGKLGERKLLLSAVQRVVLMMYELSQSTDSLEQKTRAAQRASQKLLDMAYEGLSAPNLAKMVIALRSQDYGEVLPQVLKRLDESNRSNPRYLGWARHSYNDQLKAPHSPTSGERDTGGKQ